MSKTTWTESRQETFVVIKCGGCGVDHAITQSYIDARRKDGKTWYCPNQCPRVYRETEADRLRKELETTRNRADYYRRAEESEREQHDRTKRSRARYKGEVTRVKNRVGRGVCPCCNRHFANLERHMANKHPSYTEPTQ